jgi:transposase
VERAGSGWNERSGASLKKSVGEAREKLGRNATTSFVIIDAQSVKNTDSAEQKGYDAGKKVSGIKRHIAVDTQGLPHAIAVTTADVTDRNGALAAIDRCKPNLEPVQSVLVDGGYTGEPFADGVMKRIKATVQVVKRNQLHTFVVLPKRWIVERSFAWLEKSRRRWKNCERKLNTSLQMIHLAFLRLLLRRS